MVIAFNSSRAEKNERNYNTYPIIFIHKITFVDRLIHYRLAEPAKIQHMDSYKDTRIRLRRDFSKFTPYEG